jgi:hypothetical protein
MKVRDAVARVQLGEPLRMVAIAHREHVLAELELEPDDVSPRERWDETRAFMDRLCRELGERHADDSRIAAALAEWVRRVDDYEAFDSLLANFKDFEGRDQLVRRGRQLFPGPLTAHWESSV